MWQTALKKFEVIWSTLPDHITLDFLKAVFHKFYWSILEYFDPYNLGLLQSVFLVPRSFVREWRYFDELNCGKPYLLALSLTLCLIEIICVTWIIRIFFFEDMWCLFVCKCNLTSWEVERKQHWFENEPGTRFFRAIFLCLIRWDTNKCILVLSSLDIYYPNFKYRLVPIQIYIYAIKIYSYKLTNF